VTSEAVSECYDHTIIVDSDFCHFPHAPLSQQCTHDPSKAHATDWCVFVCIIWCLILRVCTFRSMFSRRLIQILYALYMQYFAITSVIVYLVWEIQGMLYAKLFVTVITPRPFYKDDVRDYALSTSLFKRKSVGCWAVSVPVLPPTSRRYVDPILSSSTIPLILSGSRQHCSVLCCFE
jgi:hypothetical protein